MRARARSVRAFCICGLAALVAVALMGIVGVDAAEAQRRGRRRAPPTPAQVEQAHKLFIQGNQHYQTDHLDQALESFLAT